MTLSFVLRLVPEALALGELRGEVEAVASGARTTIRSVDDLVAALGRDLEPTPIGSDSGVDDEVAVE